MKKLSVIVTLILATLLLASMQSPATAPLPRHCKGLDTYFYASPEQAYAALQSGEIDLMDWPLTYEQYLDAVYNLDIQLASCAENRIFEFDFNNNHTIASYPGIPSPMYYVGFREAVAFLINKTWISDALLHGFCDRVDTWVPRPSQEGWVNRDFSYPDYPYEYDESEAVMLLDGGGFTQGTTPNPYYDPTDPYSAKYLRVYPVSNPPRYHVFHKKCMPDLGQHSTGWCWVAALANSLYWLSKHGKPNGYTIPVVAPENEKIDPDSQDKTKTDWYDSNCNGTGYMKILRKIAEAAGKKYCQGITNSEYEAMLDKILNNTGLEWKKITSPSLDDYKNQLFKCEDVMLVLKLPGSLHDVTGVSYDNTKNPPTIDISNPWTNICNNKLNHPKEYEEYEVLNSTQLTIMYRGGVVATVEKMYYISPKPKPPHPKEGLDLDPIIICVRSDQAQRLAAGRYLAHQLRMMGIPVSLIEEPKEVLYPKVMVNRDYHIYTGSWSLDQYAVTNGYSMYHSDFWFPGGSNYVTGMNEYNQPNYPDLDDALEELYSADNMTEAEFWSDITQEIAIEHCISVWLYSPVSYYAYRKNLVGIVNMDGYGPVNKYTYLNAYKVDNPETPEDESQEPIKIGLPNAPINLNPLYSAVNPFTPDVNYAGWKVMDETVYTHLTNKQPYALDIDAPWVTQDWEVTEWYDPQDGETKTKVTYWIRKDVWWHAPVTGEEVRKFTAHDVEFSIWYIYAFDDGWQWHSVMDVHHTTVLDDFTIEVYFDVQSMWTVHWIEQIPLFPKYEYLDLLCKECMCEFLVTEPRFPSDKDILPCDTILQMISATKFPEGIPLVEGVDYEVFGTGAPYYCHNEIHWLRPLLPGEWIVFQYWCPDLDPHGYYLAGLDWSLTWYTLGTHYPIEIEPGVGGWALFNCNPTHFLGAPPLGEIDWVWYWVGTTKPRNGYYQINLYDAVLLLKAYCSRGDGVPSPNWFPGADLDPDDLCHVGLYDAVIVLYVYGTKFGIPP